MRVLGYVTKCSHSQPFLPQCTLMLSLAHAATYMLCGKSYKLTNFYVSYRDLTVQVWKLSRTQHVAVLATELLNGVFQWEEGQAGPVCWRAQGLLHLLVLGPAVLEVTHEL